MGQRVQRDGKTVKEFQARRYYALGLIDPLGGVCCNLTLCNLARRKRETASVR